MFVCVCVCVCVCFCAFLFCARGPFESVKTVCVVACLCGCACVHVMTYIRNYKKNTASGDQAPCAIDLS